MATVFPGVLMRSVARLSALLLVGVMVVVADTHGQGQASPDHGKVVEKKHYLTFQVSYFGTAERSQNDASGQSQTNIDVNDRFTGRIEVHPTEAYDLPTGQSAEAQLAQMAAMQAAVAAGDADKLQTVTPPLLVTWFPQNDQVDLTGTISETKTLRATGVAHGESRATSDLGTESYRGQKGFGGNFVNAFVKIHAAEKTYDIQFTLMPDMASTGDAVHQTLVSDHKEEGHDRHAESEAKVPLDMGPGQMALGYSNYQIVAEAKGQPLAGEANELIGHTRIPVPKPAGWDGSWDIGLMVSWQIDVTLPPLELVITADGYEAWRPEGNIKKPQEPGNSLTARATLKPKEGTGTFVPKVKSIRFQLLDTSREPGVCLNWPLAAKDTDYDLRLEAVAGGKLSKSDQILEVADPKRNDAGQAYAEAKINSYDFGGRASLRAICLLNDGREIEGVMQDVGEAPRLPKMKHPGWVADSWKKAHQVEKLADDDDNEEVKGQKDNGDGFTLYEEYRGWVEKGKHIEGDPKGKDFFVLNLMQADGKGGIALFERLSKLRVHSRLRDATEMAQEDRLMNGNHRDAPHRKVDQHGVVLSHEAGGAGGYNVGVEGADRSKAGRPRDVKLVYVETHHENGAFAAKSSAKYNLSERDAASAYDRGVAHELLHSVGVDHHGELLWKYVKCYFQGASAPLNPTHRARFTTDFSLFAFQIKQPDDWSGDRGDTITLRWEDTKGDLVEEAIPAYEAELAKARAIAATENYVADFQQTAGRLGAMGITHDATFWSEYFADLIAASDRYRAIRVGADQGTDCGNELCVMRYYFANAYRAAGSENSYYLIRPGAGANRAGREICKSPDGTGTNAKSHDPQSRFGDAHSGRGNCFGDICPNDSIPPRSVILQ